MENSIQPIGLACDAVDAAVEAVTEWCYEHVTENEWARFGRDYCRKRAAEALAARDSAEWPSDWPAAYLAAVVGELRRLISKYEGPFL